MSETIKKKNSGAQNIKNKQKLKTNIWQSLLKTTLKITERAENLEPGHSNVISTLVTILGVTNTSKISKKKKRLGLYEADNGIHPIDTDKFKESFENTSLDE